MSEISEKHAVTQARQGAWVTAGVLAQTLLKGRPADRALSAAFYEHRELGSRDRRLISETLFSVLRWWGWLRPLFPATFTAAYERGDGEAALSVPLQDFYAAFAAAWYLEGRGDVPLAVRCWLSGCGVEESRIRRVGSDAPVSERAGVLKAFLRGRPAVELSESSLLPLWCGPYVHLPDGVPEGELVSWLQRRPPVWLRIQSSEPDVVYREFTEHGLRAARHPRMADAWQLYQTSGVNLRGLSSFRSGQFEIQDLASQLVVPICSPKPGSHWWDACAGGGGKTLHLASALERRGTVLATDIRVHKLEDLKLRARRASFPNIRCKEWKGKEIPTFRNRFDGVLVDTACSCSGTWRRNPDARWTTHPEEIEGFHSLQLQLLTNASQGVKVGGTLVYSTCSMFERENRAVVEEFLSLHGEFERSPFCCPLTGRGGDGMNQIWPWDGDCDAMFTARMVRKS